jgi:hypothetical protein
MAETREGRAGKGGWESVVRFLIDLLDALARSLEAWRKLLTTYDVEVLDTVRNVGRLREVIREAPEGVKVALVDARLALEEVLSILAGDPTRIMDKDEFQRIIAILTEAREKLSKALEESGGSGGS